MIIGFNFEHTNGDISLTHALKVPKRVRKLIEFKVITHVSHDDFIRNRTTVGFKFRLDRQIKPRTQLFKIYGIYTHLECKSLSRGLYFEFKKSNNIKHI